MATWITHLMIADGVLKELSQLDRLGFCVGNIAPDCNVENKDWTQFTPSREITHWMSDDRKKATDCERFLNEYIIGRKSEIDMGEEFSFLLGYYAHLVSDSEFQRFIRDESRVKALWGRIRQHPVLAGKIDGMDETWESAKQLINYNERMKDIYVMEAEYIEKNPDSGYLTEVLPLKTFPDYIEYLPKGAVVRKIGVMGYLPNNELGLFPFVAMTRQEYSDFICVTTELIIRNIKDILNHIS